MEGQGRGGGHLQRKPRRGKGGRGSGRSPGSTKGRGQGVTSSPSSSKASTSSNTAAAVSNATESVVPRIEPEIVSLPPTSESSLEVEIQPTEKKNTLHLEKSVRFQLTAMEKSAQEKETIASSTSSPSSASPEAEVNVTFTGEAESSKIPLLKGDDLVVEPIDKPRGDYESPKEIQLPLPSPVSKFEKETSAEEPKVPVLRFPHDLGTIENLDCIESRGPGSKSGSDRDDPWDDTTRKPERSRQTVSSNSKATATIMGFSKRQWLTLLVFGLADFFSAIIFAIQAPFYPAEAEKKGATATEYGFVFGIFELVVFLVSPIFGKYMNRLGPKFVFNAGIFTSGTCCIFFGLLDGVNDHTAFITLSFILRILEAVGTAAFCTASFTIIGCEFPESVATTFATLETFFGLGMIVGPSMGGVLFQLGGFTLPFVVTGVGLFLVSIITAFLMPKIISDTSEDGKHSKGYGICSILKIPAVFLAAISITMGANSIGYLNATLEPHLRQFSLSPVQIGLMFIISGGIYAVVAPAWGWLCDRSSQPKYIMFLGALFVFIAFLLIGPAPFIPLDTMLWLTAVGLFIHGIAIGAILVSGFILALRDCMDHGFPDNISTYGVVSGLWTSSLSLGAFIGPSVAGVLYDNVGFRVGSVFILAGEAVVMVLVATYMFVSKKPKVKQDDSEVQPLLRSSSPVAGPSSKDTLLNLSSYGTTGESDT